MIYPDNFEKKLGIDKIRNILKGYCLSDLGKDLVQNMSFSNIKDEVALSLQQTREFRNVKEAYQDIPLAFFFDVRMTLKRIRLENTHFEIEELFDFRRSLDTINKLVGFIQEINRVDDNEDGGNILKRPYPALYDLQDGIATFPVLVQQADQIMDKWGRIRDSASPELLQIRRELKRMEGSVSQTLHHILHSAQAEGLVDKDTAPTLRDGRLVIPIAPGVKRKIQGIVHDESASGRTLYIEPTEVVEANNKIRDLENKERQELIRILTTYTKRVRPHINEIVDSYRFLAQIDFIQAREGLAKAMRATEPTLSETPTVDWIEARHPLLEQSLHDKSSNRVSGESLANEHPNRIVPLEITLKADKHILIISGPNAGGKSVCLKTVGLLQYMLQCGLSIPVSDRSSAGIFDDIMIDIGDEQSLENDLSTYSSHLWNMKNMIKQASDRTLILIDEFGTGTEPQIGAAIAQAVLTQFWGKKAWAVITTHYQNLKHFSEDHPGVVNGAMLYDRHEMRPLFQLAIGRPGSSFAIEIARKIGLPESVIQEASDIVGSDYIQSDKYLQDIVRDKRYWENKRQAIHQREKDLEKRIAEYEETVERVEKSRKEIITRAKAQANDLIKESNKRIENAIREIKEHQAEKEETRKVRQELAKFQQDIADSSPAEEKKSKKGKNHGLLTEEEFQAKVDKLRERKLRHEKRQAEKAAKKSLQQATPKPSKDAPLVKGDSVRIKGLTSVGTIESVDGKMALVIFGGMKTMMRLERLERYSQATNHNANTNGKTTLSKIETYKPSSIMTRNTIDEHQKSFKPEIDVRGFRTDEVLLKVQRFVDDALLVGSSQLRILHGKGNGILRQEIQKFLKTMPYVKSVRDEHVQFGGAGITVVEL